MQHKSTCVFHFESFTYIEFLGRKAASPCRCNHLLWNLFLVASTSAHPWSLNFPISMFSPQSPDNFMQLHDSYLYLFIYLCFNQHKFNISHPDIFLHEYHWVVLTHQLLSSVALPALSCPAFLPKESHFHAHVLVGHANISPLSWTYPMTIPSLSSRLANPCQFNICGNICLKAPLVLCIPSHHLSVIQAKKYEYSLIPILTLVFVEVTNTEKSSLIALETADWSLLWS